MTLVVKHIATKLFVALIALQIINLSIDSVEFQPIQNEITFGDFNYINSLTEYVSEIILGHTNAFPEFQKESSSSKSQLVKHLSLKLFSSEFSIAVARTYDNAIQYIVPLKEKYSFLFYKEINPPPPKTSIA
jgi:hypothetical protein